MAELDRTNAFIVLNGLPNIGPITLRRLLDAFNGDPVAIFEAPTSHLKSVKGVGDAVVDTLRNWTSHLNLEKQLQRMEKGGIRFVVTQSDDYPPLLKEIYDPPIGLYWKGDYVLDRPTVAIVGSRRTTVYGRHVARKLGRELARCGFCVVSGGARGVDTEAHKGALEVDGKTIAVMGCGMDIVYPAENFELFNSIVETGAVVSEFPFGRRADRQTFPMRNRIVSGMCQGLVVVESDINGGSMISARFAAEQGRTVFAVPGRIDQSTSRGCHQLIREGASLLSRPEDVVEELGYLLVERDSGEAISGQFNRPDLTDDEQLVLSYFEGGEVLDMDRLLDLTGKSSPELASVLMMLELKHMVLKRFDGTFEASVRL
ncbi:MAG: DNA-processing protein DprA [Verrucomicrobiae bacterium]|nr:DNA-processing protein DprA [Verrucomicrobiae bacterium]